MTYVFPTADTMAVFIDGIHIDLAHRLDFKDSLPKIPLFGYNDKHFSVVMQSRNIVQGFLTINFIYPGYLSALLKQHSDKKVLNNGRTEIADKEDVNRFVFNELPPNTSPESKQARAEYIANLLTQRPATLGRNNDSNLLGGIKDATKQLARKESFKQALLERFIDGKLEDINKEVIIQNPLSYNNKELNMDVYYSNPEDAVWLVRFKNLHFTDISQSNSSSGAEGSASPILETYEFIARSREIVHIK